MEISVHVGNDNEAPLPFQAADSKLQAATEYKATTVTEPLYSKNQAGDIKCKAAATKQLTVINGSRQCHLQPDDFFVK